MKTKEAGERPECVTVLFFPVACSMGNGTSRLYSVLAKTLNSSTTSQHPEYLVSPDPEHLEPIDPKELLEECRAVLHTRPPRFQRDFVDLRTECPSSHPPIRVMQWNILAQGMPGALALQQPSLLDCISASAHPWCTDVLHGGKRRGQVECRNVG